MSEPLLAYELPIRVAVFLGMLALMATWEVVAPRRPREFPRLLRWTGNLGIIAIDTMLVRLFFPVFAVTLALLAEERGWGLFNTVETPAWFAIPVSVILFDLAIYFSTSSSTP